MVALPGPPDARLVDSEGGRGGGEAAADIRFLFVFVEILNATLYTLRERGEERRGWLEGAQKEVTQRI